MSANWKSPDRRQFIWPAAGVLLGALASINPFYRPHVTIEIGIAVWFADMILALLCTVHPTAARIGSLVIGLSLTVSFFFFETLHCSGCAGMDGNGFGHCLAAVRRARASTA